MIGVTLVRIKIGLGRARIGYTLRGYEYKHGDHTRGSAGIRLQNLLIVQQHLPLITLTVNQFKDQCIYIVHIKHQIVSTYEI